MQDIAAREPGSFDLVILSDVIHHVPDALRSDILGAIRAALKPGGRFVFKDWARSFSPIHWLCHAGDRWLTGDRVRYVDSAEAERMIAEAFPGGRISARAFVRPWRNNFAFLVEP